MKDFNGFTLYETVSDIFLGTVNVVSNMQDLYIYDPMKKDIYTAEIIFLENKKIEPANPYRLTLRKDREAWKLTGQMTSFTSDKLTITLYKIEYYVDGEEYIYWDTLNYIHRIHGDDMMKETRKNIGME